MIFKSFNNGTCAALASLCAFLASTVVAYAQVPDAAVLFEKLSPSVWTVQVQTRIAKFQGSAVVIQDGQLITNCHVLRNGLSVVVYHGNESHPASLLFPDPARDLCILGVKDFHQPAVSIAPAESLRIGQRVFAIGSPRSFQNTLSDGLLSAIIHGPDDSIKMIQTSAPISHGSSGGGLFDDQGRLIGITSASVEPSQAENLNFAIPASWIAEVPERARILLAERKQAQETQEANSAQKPDPTPPPAAQPEPEAPLSPKTRLPSNPVFADASAGDETRTYRTRRDTEIILSTHARWDSFCRLDSAPGISILRPPLHGRIEIRDGDFINRAAGAHTVGCVDQRMHGKIVYYRPDPGFNGVDSARYSVYTDKQNYTRFVSVSVIDSNR